MKNRMLVPAVWALFLHLTFGADLSARASEIVPFAPNSPPEVLCRFVEERANTTVREAVRRLAESATKVAGQTNDSRVEDVKLLLNALGAATNDLGKALVLFDKLEAQVAADEARVKEAEKVAEPAKRLLLEQFDRSRATIDTARTLVEEKIAVFTRVLTKKGPALIAMAELAGGLSEQTAATAMLNGTLEKVLEDLKADLASFGSSAVNESRPIKRKARPIKADQKSP